MTHRNDHSGLLNCEFALLGLVERNQSEQITYDVSRNVNTDYKVPVTVC
jgi:hypothetical protein